MRSISVKSILRLSILTLVLGLVALLGSELRDSWTSWRDATAVADATRISTRLVVAFQNVRLDRGGTYRALISEPTEIAPAMRDMRKAAMDALKEADRMLKASGLDLPGAEIARFSRQIDVYAELEAKTAAAIGQPRAQRPQGLADAWQKDATAYIDHLSAAIDEVEARIRQKDPVIDVLLSVKRAAIEARGRAGDATQIVSNSTAGAKMPADALARFYGNVGATSATLTQARDVLKTIAAPAELTAAVDQAVSLYASKAFRDPQEKQFQTLLAGEKPPLDTEKWVATFTPVLGAIADIGSRALAAAEVQASRLATTAETALMVQAGLLVGVLCLAAGLLLVLTRRVTRPLTVIKERVEQLAQGRLDVEAPYLDRSDEIGALGKAMATFRTNMAETERLRAAQVEQEKAQTERRRDEMNALAEQFDRAVGQAVEIVASSAAELQASAQTLSSVAEDTNHRSLAVSAASEQASANVASVASATEELTSSIGEVSRRVQMSSDIARAAVAQVEATDRQVAGLAEAAEKVGSIVTLIEDIANMTNLLALNATIEAARAGNAGKGFAVVAAEVKQLADQTAKATAQIAAQLGSIQAASGEAGTAIKGIGQTIQQMSTIAVDVAKAVADQGEATNEIARNIHEASRGTVEVSENIGQVTEAASQSHLTSDRVLVSAKDLSQQAALLSQEVRNFLSEVRVSVGARG